MEINAGTNQRELPKYKSHKTVWALKIKDIQKFEFLRDPVTGNKPDNYYTIIPENKKYAPFEVGEEYYNKNKPQVGGYFVQYDGGYTSYSPADAFEGGYTLI